MQHAYSVTKKVLILVMVMSLFLSGVIVSVPTTSVRAQTTTPILDNYGGDTALPLGHNTTGRWTVELINNQYWFVTPDNHRLWVLGDQHCTPGPAWQGAIQGDTQLPYSPIALVNQAKYSSPNILWMDAWIAKQVERTKNWGLNTTLIMDNAVTPDSISRFKLLDMNTISPEPVPAVSKYFPDVFDLRYKDACAIKAGELIPYASSSNLIGVYLGNERTWNGLPVIGLPNTFIGLSGSTAGKKYWVNDFLKPRYATVEALNAKYGTSFSSWDSVLACTSLKDHTEDPENKSFPDTAASRAIHADKIAFAEIIVRAYYKPLVDAIKAVDDKLLILSDRMMDPMDSRFTNYLDYQRCIWKVAGQYCDVLCINNYLGFSTYKDSATNQQTNDIVSAISNASGILEPILVTEHSYYANDTNLKGFGRDYNVYTQTDRASNYVNYLNTLLRTCVKGTTVHPFIGVVWHKWYDDPIGGSSSSGGDNFNHGLLDGQDEAYTPLVDAMATANSQVYDAIAGSRIVTLLPRPVPYSATVNVSAGSPVVFSWKTVPGAGSYTLLISPEEAFPDEQTIRHSGIAGTTYALLEPLPGGIYWWCVCANENGTGHSGYYSNAGSFTAKNTLGSLDDALKLDHMNRVTFQGMSPADENISSLAFRDEVAPKQGTASVKCVFTNWSIPPNGLEAPRKDASVIVDCSGTTDYWDGITVSVRPAAFCSIDGVIVPSSKYVRLQIWDRDGELVVDKPVDPCGDFALDTWKDFVVSFSDCGPQIVSKMALTVVYDSRTTIDPSKLIPGCLKPVIPMAFDQRLTINIDNIVPNVIGVEKPTVTFDSNGGTVEASPISKSVIPGGTVLLPFSPKRTGYSFINWNTEKNGTGTRFTSATPITANITVYAQWKANQYTVSFNKNGGKTSASPSSTGVAYGGTVKLPVPPVRTGYTFVGWNTKTGGDGTPFTAATVVTASVTVYAQWSPCTVTFHKNGGRTSAVPASIKVAYGGTTTLPIPPTRTDYTFLGWNTKSNGKGVAFTAATPVTATMTVYALWRPNRCTVTFSSNGGTVSASPRTMTVVYGTAVSTLPVAPKKTGYTFIGWNTKQNGTGTSYNGTAPVTVNITVYAQWKKN